MMIFLWLTLLCSVDSGEALFEQAMSLEGDQAQVVFAEAAAAFVDGADLNSDPNLMFNAGLAWAQAGEYREPIPGNI